MGGEIGLTAFSRSIRHRRYPCTSDHNSLPRACRYERGGQCLYSVATIEISPLTLRFYRNFGLPTCDNCIPLPRHCLCFNSLSPRCLSICPYVVQILFSVEYIPVTALVRKRKPFAPFRMLPCPPSVLRSVASQPFTGDTPASPSL